MVEFPDFKRKWKAQVAKCRLAEDLELDRLKDSLNPEARRAIYSMYTLEEAWRKLDMRYGNKSLISEKLKIELKSMKLSAKW